MNDLLERLQMDAFWADAHRMENPTLADDIRRALYILDSVNCCLTNMEKQMDDFRYSVDGILEASSEELERWLD